MITRMPVLPYPAASPEYFAQSLSGNGFLCAQWEIAALHAGEHPTAEDEEWLRQVVQLLHEINRASHDHIITMESEFLRVRIRRILQKPVESCTVMDQHALVEILTSMKQLGLCKSFLPVVQERFDQVRLQLGRCFDESSENDEPIL